MTSQIPRRTLLRSALVAGAAGTVGAAAGPVWAGQPAPARCSALSVRSGKLFMSTNGINGNQVQVYQRQDEGAASLLFSVPTGGLGTGAGLASQGAVVLSTSGRYLFVVNAGSNTLSTFRLRNGGLELVSTVDTGGPSPSSVTESHGLVYVMNRGAGGTGLDSSITGFRNHKGVLTPIAGSTRSLDLSGGPVLGQVGLDGDGSVIVVTDRNNTVYSWPVMPDGTPGPVTATPSPGGVPFGFAFTRRDVLVVSEAAGTATSGGSTVSSYVLKGKATVPALVTAALPTTQGAACWVVVTPDGRYAFSANAASSSISSFRVERGGALTLLAGVAASMPGAGALDMAISPDGSQLNIFGSGTPQRIFTYGLEEGVLTLLGSTIGPVLGSAGLAAN